MAKAKKTTLKKAAAKKPTAKKTAAKKPAPKKAVARKAATKKATAQKPVAKKATPKPKAAPKPVVATPTKTSKPSAAALAKVVSPLDDRILVWVDEKKETTTPSGLILITEEKSEKVIGRVEAVGRGHMNKKGKIRPLDIQKGDQVMFPRHAGTAVTVEGVDLFILRESEVLGIVEKN